MRRVARHHTPANLLALSKAVIGLRLTATGGEITFSYRSQPMEPTDNMIKVVMERAWRWKLELSGNLGELEILTGKLYLNDLRDAVKSSFRISLANLYQCFKFLGVNKTKWC